MEIIGTTIGDFSAASLRVDGRAVPGVRVTHLPNADMVLAIQSSWNTSPGGSFHWPAVFNRNPDAATFAVHDGGATSNVQALFQCSFGADVACDRDVRRAMTYLSFLEVAPWNRHTSSASFRGLGTFVVITASSMSAQTAAQGALGLHTLDTSAGFYRRLGFKDVDCLNEYKELYLELSVAQARDLRSRNGARS